MSKRPVVRPFMGLYATEWTLGPWWIDLRFWPQFRHWRLEVVSFRGLCRGGSLQVGPFQIEIAG